MWLDDLRWHKHMFRQSRFRWWDEHAMRIVTRHTGGQLEFSTVRHLELLQQYQYQVGEHLLLCREAMAEPLRQARDTLGGWEPVAAALGLSVVDCKVILWFAAGTRPEDRTNVNVKAVLRKLPFSNPLIQAWELKQLWRLYEAAADIFEDAICDLIEELRPTRPEEVLVRASQDVSPVGLAARVRHARQERGGPEDPRRTPAQIF